MTAVIYARYSSDNQREESIEGQIRECTAYAEKNGITIVKHYIDRAISAKTDNRPEFQQMIKDSDKKLFDKAEDDYLLTTKLFCGCCGALMFGESGTSRTGEVHRYYKCATAKKHKGCKKKTVRKQWLEDLVVNQTMQLVKDDVAMESIIAKVMELQNKENTNIPLYEKQLRDAESGIQNMLNAIQAGILTSSTKELAKISPLTMSDMVGAEKMMLGFNIQAEDTIKYLKAISDISMGESSKFNSLTLAFSQMSAAGKLMGQDLNQMINAGFNPLQIISEKTGKSIATLKDEMSKGAVSAEMVQQAFIDATSAGGKFYNMSENASKTINGQLSMMQDALDSVFNELGTKSESVIMDGIQMTTSLSLQFLKMWAILCARRNLALEQLKTQ